MVECSMFLQEFIMSVMISSDSGVVISNEFSCTWRHTYVNTLPHANDVYVCVSATTLNDTTPLESSGLYRTSLVNWVSRID